MPAAPPSSAKLFSKPHWSGVCPTLPSGMYLQYPPQYFQPDPDFPLEKELTTMEAQGAAHKCGPELIPMPRPLAQPTRVHGGIQ